MTFLTPESEIKDLTKAAPKPASVPVSLSDTDSSLTDKDHAKEVIQKFGTKPPPEPARVENSQKKI